MVRDNNYFIDLRNKAATIIKQLDNDDPCIDVISSAITEFLPEADNVCSTCFNKRLYPKSKKNSMTYSKENIIKICNKVMRILNKTPIDEMNVPEIINKNKYLKIGDNNALFRNFFESLSDNKAYKINQEGDYLADLSTRDKKLKANAIISKNSIIPSLNSVSEDNIDNIEFIQQQMASYIAKMDDLTCDVLCIINSLWVDTATSPDDYIVISVDTILKMRNIKPMKDQKGNEFGYRAEQRRTTAEHIDILANTWINVKEMEVYEEKRIGTRNVIKKRKWRGESPAIIIDSRYGFVKDNGSIDPFVWKIKPGGVFSQFLLSDGKNLAMLSRKALEFDPYREKDEKRLAVFFAWQWDRSITKETCFKTFKVKELLAATHRELGINNRSRTRERLESCLDNLVNYSIISSWNYNKIDESIIGYKGSYDYWLDCDIVIESPIIKPAEKTNIVEPYNNEPVTLIDSKKEKEIFCNIKSLRKEKKLTLKQISEETGISISQLSRLERGLSTPIKTRDILSKWIKNNL